MAASAGSIAAAPMIATITKSDGQRGRLDHGLAAGGDLDAAAGKAGLEFAEQRLIADHRERGPHRQRLLDQHFHIVCRRSAP